MFESDQHDFDDEYEGYRHAAPASPSPAQVHQVAAPMIEASQAASTTTHAETTATDRTANTSQAAAEAAVGVLDSPAAEEPKAASAEETEEDDSATEEKAVKPIPKKGKAPVRKNPNFVLIGGFAALMIFAAFVVVTVHGKETSNAPLPGDLGPGIVAVSGLRGHLDTRWDGDAKTGRVSYQLRIEPMEDRWGGGFSHVALNPPMPMSLNIRLLDSQGFALCGKEIDFHFDPQNAGIPIAVEIQGNGKKISAAERAAVIQAARQNKLAQMQADETAREQGKDVFQNQTTTEGQVSALNVQGTLPCSPDQYRHVDYWDFNTNFPTLQEQAALLDPKAAVTAAKALNAAAHPGKRVLSKLPQQGFVMQGDDRVTGYDSAHGLLSAESRSFQVDRRYGQATASAWANDYSLIHYRCDQQANCALTAAGEAAVLHARLNE